MARSVSETYLAASKAASKTPYFKLIFHPTAGGSNVDLSSDSSAYGNRILYIDSVEEPYNDYATIIFRNKDRDIPSLLGYWIEIGWGYVTGAGNEYLGDGTNEPAPPRLWVKHQQTISAGGKLWELLELEGMWSLLRETLIRVGSPPLYTASYTTDTIYDIIGIILGEVDPAMTLNALEEDDGIIDSLQPQFDINAQPFEYADALIYRLLNMTASYLKPLDDLEWEIKYPQDDDAVDLTFYSYQAPYFYEYMERTNVLIPNHIIVYGNEGDDGLWTSYLTGEAEDTDEEDSYADIIKVVLAGSLTSQDDVDNRAAALLKRAKFEQMAGRMVAPHNGQVELYDNLAIYDTRGIA
jgi:hypothetical protein